MARCGCAGQTCSCLIQGGEGVEVIGSGTVGDPYIINTQGSDIAGSIQFVDTDTIDFTVTGAGTEANPYQIRADATMSLDSLSDVDAPAPTENYVLAWNGTAWVPAPPNTVDPGTISTLEPITGDGTAGDPIALSLVTDDSLTGTGTATDPLRATHIVAEGYYTTEVPGGGTVNQTITFPTGRFTEVPGVFVSPLTANIFTRGATANALTMTSFQLNLGKTAGTMGGNLGCHWLAVQDLLDVEAFSPMARALPANGGPLGAPADVTVTCPTDGCGNQGVPIEIASTVIDEESGATTPVTRVSCGVCGTDISDTMRPIETS